MLKNRAEKRCRSLQLLVDIFIQCFNHLIFFAKLLFLKIYYKRIILFYHDLAVNEYDITLFGNKKGYKSRKVNALF